MSGAWCAHQLHHSNGFARLCDTACNILHVGTAFSHALLCIFCMHQLKRKMPLAGLLRLICAPAVVRPKARDEWQLSPGGTHCLALAKHRGNIVINHLPELQGSTLMQSAWVTAVRWHMPQGGDEQVLHWFLLLKPILIHMLCAVPQ